jgi:hypothetical protein
MVTYDISLYLVTNYVCTLVTRGCEQVSISICKIHSHPQTNSSSSLWLGNIQEMRFIFSSLTKEVFLCISEPENELKVGELFAKNKLFYIILS